MAVDPTLRAFAPDAPAQELLRLDREATQLDTKLGGDVPVLLGTNK